MGRPDPVAPTRRLERTVQPLRRGADEVAGLLPAVPAVALAGERLRYAALTWRGRRVKVSLTLQLKEWRGKECVAVELSTNGNSGEKWWQEGLGVVRTTTHNPVTGTSGYSELVDWRFLSVED